MPLMHENVFSKELVLNVFSKEFVLLGVSSTTVERSTFVRLRLNLISSDTKSALCTGIARNVTFFYTFFHFRVYMCEYMCVYVCVCVCVYVCVYIYIYTVPGFPT